MVEVTLDYGADISLLPKDLGDRLVKYPPITVEDVTDAAGGENVGESYRVKALVAGKEVLIPMVAVPDIPSTLLGRLGVMDRFFVVFSPEGFEIRPSGAGNTGERLVLFNKTTGDDA